MKKIVLFFLSVFLIACSSSSDQPLRTGNSITLFQLTINGELVNGQINQSNNSIVFNVIDANLTSLTPTITISEGATINPSLNSSRNFNESVRYTVTAENGIEREYVVIVNNTIRSSENFITLFQFNVNGETVNGEIDQENNTVRFDLVGADVSTLAPTVEISEGASIAPNSGISQDFSESVFYTVTAENGEERRYEINVSNRPFSTGNEIISFIVTINGEPIEARIDQDINEIAFETGSFNISALVPEIEISENATIAPASGETVDFSVPVTYTVTAENGVSTQYTVAINQAYKINAFTLVGPRFGAQLLFTRAEMFIDLDFLDPLEPEVELFLDDGSMRVDLPILETASFENQRIITNRVTTKIPKSASTSTNYRIVYKNSDILIESDFFIDVLAENSPEIISVNQDSYREGDTLIVTGENLTDFIGVPSNGSFFLFNPQGNIDVELNPERTEYRLLMEGSFSRSAFFPFDAVTRDVIFMTPERRLGDQITINID
ncbi:DUF5018 domain-containing protein [Allomuricauda sp. d1]|uniref:DUF5018 domain-containing protein n=1 Tax=Allomuricauda sp. d1 TaxID=3136725 RepID=UPI0031D1ECF6